MASLEDVYEGHVGEVQSVRRLYLGTGLFLVGAVLAVVGMVVGAANPLSGVGVSQFQSRLIAGVLGGVGFPTVVLGVFTVLPAETRIRAAAAIGASVTALGVALFWYAYPDHWAGYGDDLTLHVTTVYFLGVITLIGCLFAGIATLKRRNDPGGTVQLEVTKQGETKVVEVDRSELDGGLGGVGMLGGTPDGDVETQTNRTASTRTGGETTRSRGSGTRNSTGAGATPTSDGGSAASDITSPLDGGSTTAGSGRAGGPAADDGEVMDDGPSPTELTDTYCGNCEHFEYVRTGQGMQPYCQYYGERMDDMEACDQWEPNN
ncbi:DUF7139 domain-containing protein [Halostella pelagica]|uniref:DUF7139 domain-containing protein n=1 Tax=Halostella pelagica TaxID=2583824 RepID=UPI00108182CA|nr:hypothetical protein [Halostella pelagica]